MSPHAQGDTHTGIEHRDVMTLDRPLSSSPIVSIILWTWIKSHAFFVYKWCIWDSLDSLSLSLSWEREIERGSSTNHIRPELTMFLFFSSLSPNARYFTKKITPSLQQPYNDLLFFIDFRDDTHGSLKQGRVKSPTIVLPPHQTMASAVAPALATLPDQISINIGRLPSFFALKWRSWCRLSSV